MKQPRPSTSPSGFTLIEVVITLAVTAIIFTIVSISFNRVNSRSALTLTAETLASDLRGTAMKALNAEQFQLQDPGNWGIYGNAVTEEYILFADLNNNNAYDTNEKYKSVVLSNHITIDYFSFDTTGWTDQQAIMFETGTASPYFNSTPVTEETSYAGVILGDANGTATMEVRVNSAGTVDVILLTQ